MDRGFWSTCPVCGGSGRYWYDTGADVPMRATCDACAGLGVAEWVEAEPVVLPCDTARFDAPYDAAA
jgi:DnaJ-class molecular chaperone